MSFLEFSCSREIFQWFQSFVNLERKDKLYTSRNYRLDRMNYLLTEFGDPHQGFEIFHIAGSKGKGSTAHFLGHILAAEGYRTGLFTSPHLHSYTERFYIPGEEPEEEALLKAGNLIRRKMESLSLGKVSLYNYPTTFELLTLFAFLYFKERGCTHLVLETGLGGRLDATNVVVPRASLITSIELEHQEILGNTLEAIAREKGGIIKPGVPLFSGVYQEDLKALYRRLCGGLGSPCRFLEDEVKPEKVRVTREGTGFSLDGRELLISPLGEIQARNGAMAWWVARECLPEISPEIRARGLGAASLPGRMEVISREVPFIFDGAHTPVSIRMMLQTYTSLFQPGTLIFGVIKDKEPLEMIKLLAPRVRRVIIARPGNFKESNLRELHTLFSSFHSRVSLIPDPREALEAALEGEQENILVTGSFYLVAEIRKFLV